MNGQPSEPESSWGTPWKYTAGFLWSLLLTMTGYFLVRYHVAHHHLYPTDGFMVGALLVLAVIQLMVQLIFFLHLDRGSKRRWNIVVLLFAVMIVMIIVLGSIWIMYHLNYNMSSQQMNHYLLQQDGGV